MENRLNRRQFLQLIGVAAGAALFESCTSKTLPATPTASIVLSPTPFPTSTPVLIQIDLTNRYIAYCGYDCSTCSRYQGKTCEGCLGDVCPQYCMDCKVRACNRERTLVNCAECDLYSCQKLEDLYTEWEEQGWGDLAGTARAVLEELRRTGQ